jgi:hypothetical protein
MESVNQLFVLLRSKGLLQWVLSLPTDRITNTNFFITASVVNTRPHRA